MGIIRSVLLFKLKVGAPPHTATAASCGGCSIPNLAKKNSTLCCKSLFAISFRILYRCSVKVLLRPVCSFLENVSHEKTDKKSAIE